MKINKLFAILFAVLGVQTLSAQTDVTSTYLTNPSFELGTSGSAAMTSKGFNTPFGWTSVGMPTSGTHNFDILAENATSDNSASGFGIAVKPADGSYYYFGRHSWQSALTVTLSQETTSAIPEGKYLIDVAYKLAAKDNNVGGHLTLTASQGGTSLATTSSSTSASQGTSFFNTAGWNRLAVPFTVTTDGIVKIELGMVYNPQAAVNTVQEAIIIDDVRLYNLENASSTNPIDVTGLLVNPSFELNTFNGTLDASSSPANGNYQYPTGWTFMLKTSAWTNCLPITTAPSDGNMAHEIWSGGVGTIDFHQTVTLPAGKYTISADLRTENTECITDQGVYASVAGIVTKSGTITNVASTWNSAEGWNTLSATFNNGSESEVVLGVSSTGTGSGIAGWFQVDNIRLMYLGYDLTAANEQLSTLIATAQDIVTANAATPKTIENLNTAIAAAQSVEQTKNAIETASANLTTAINAANETIDAYANFKTLLATCNTIQANSEEFEAGAKTTFTEAINTAQTNVNAATTAEAINTEYTTLETARQTYVQKADPTNDTYFDYTFKITNPSFETGNTNGWTVSSGGDTGAKSNSNATYTINGADGNYVYNTWSGSSIEYLVEQTLTGMPNGLYTLKAIVASNANNVITLTAGTSSQDVTITTNKSTATEATVEKANSTGELLIKASSSTWFKADHFRLYYYGFDATTAQNTVTTLKAEAEALTSKTMSNTASTALQTAISGADATNTTRDGLNSMISALTTAIDNAKTSIADYEKILTYINKANKINTSIAADYQTAYDNRTLSESAETVFQNLEVATYNYVTETFNYNVALSSTWNSTGTNTSAKEFNNEHWSGETRGYMNQNDDNGQGWNAQSWSLDFDQNVELPAGEYVFKVAGRKSKDAILRLVVTQGEETLGTVEDFPNGSSGLGITKTGEASFDSNDQFARNDNTGFGWQWRYVKFTLTEKSTVKIAVHAETSMPQNWVSFGDYTVQMSEETYLEANKDGLTAPTAAAQALVDTKPMGDAENAALKAALELPVTTGAELQAKINALNTAVANANAWVTAYNEAKAPLIAALERFETDYNLEGDVDHAYMCNSVWANVLAMVEAASEAKDVTNSYAGFETATNELVAALDAADTSIAEYKALKEAIDAANAAAAVNWGDQPFQRPLEDKEDLTTAINTAQAVYDAATADGADVTSQTTALNDALDVVNNLVLNAPAEGSVYNIVVATAEHPYENCPVVASLDASKANGSDANNLTGYGFAAKDGYTDGPANMLYTFTQVDGSNNYNISVKVKGETVYLTTGSLNGSAAGWNQQQIQGTTDIAKAAEFEIVASTTQEGIIKIRNTVYNEFLDCQDEASIYTDTGIEKEDFALTLVEELSADISIDAADKYATCVLMFDADLANTEGLTVYVPESYTTQDGLNYFVFKVFEEAVLPAYTPCLLYAENGFEGTLTGEVKMDGYAYNVSNGGYLYGALESQDITEGYVMVKLDDEDEVTFRNVEKYGLAESITIPAGKCWLQVPAVQASVASFTCLFRGGDASNIDEVLLDKISVKDGAIYTLDGKRVSNIERGKIYVINGQKVIVK